jgi:hypothetical protein
MSLSAGLRVLASLGAVVALIVTGCGASSATPTPTPAPTPGAGLFVDAGADLGSISPYVYGSNTGPWLPVPFELQSQIAAAGIRTLTFPGGNWGDENDIETYQIDQFVAYCKVIGATPRIVVRLKGGTAQKAADLVNYTNLVHKYGVKYWGIGNEPDLYVANGLSGYTVDQYDAEWREWATAMRAVDPTIQLIGPDVSQFVGDTQGSAYLQARTDWLASFLKADGDLVDVVSVHRYAYPVGDADTPPTIVDLQGNSREWDSIVPALRKLVKDTTGRDLPVAVTEVNSSSSANAGGEATMDSHYNAIWFGDVLGRMITQNVFMVDQFALAGDWGIVGPSGVRPMYYVYQMYELYGTERVRSASDDPNVRVYGARRSDGSLTVMIVNLGSEAATRPLTIVGGGSATSAQTWLFDAGHKAEKVTDTPLGGSVTVPPESMTLLVLPK